MLRPHELLAQLAPDHVELNGGLTSTNPLDFPGYTPPNPESVVTASSAEAVWVVFDFSVMGGSMGAVAGEKISLAYDEAVSRSLPVVVVVASGGARMQEGMVSLVQMPRTVAARSRHARAGLAQISVLRSPSTGGVYASFAALADYTIAEPGATVGFAGPRVVKDMLGADPDLSAYLSETKHQAGLIDLIAEPEDLKDAISAALRNLGNNPADPTRTSDPEPLASQPSTSWERLQVARDPSRPKGPTIALELLQDPIELKGAHPGPDDEAVVTLIGALRTTGARTLVIAQDSSTPRGMLPDGFRKVRRAIGIASRLGLSVVTLVDTRGADPLPDSELDGISVEIAKTTRALIECRSPTTAVVIGEGGSGGALALAACDRLLMQENSVFSVIAPEGASSILHRTADRAPELADQLQISPSQLLQLGIIDGVIADGVPSIAAAVSDPPTPNPDRWTRAGSAYVT